MCFWKVVLLALVVGACGRMNYDAQALDPVDAGQILAPVVDAQVVADAAPDPIPPEMRAVAGDTGTFLIDIAESGSSSWLVGTEVCGGQGKRYCTGAEWDFACFSMGAELTGMNPSSGWEWVAEVSGQSGSKRFECGQVGTHNIDTDPYEVRCCKDAP